MQEEVNRDSTSNSSQKKEKGFFRELLETLFWVLIILVPIRLYVAQPFIVVGNSMDPTFKNGDYLIIDEISYRFKEPKRGDVIVFRPPLDPKNHYVKRIIGLPGETVEVKNNIVKIINSEHPEGFLLEEESYVSSERETSITVKLQNDEYFVMGDNRAVSSDSRVWGPLHKNKITGRALVRLLPLNNVDLWPGILDTTGRLKE